MIYYNTAAHIYLSDGDLRRMGYPESGHILEAMGIYQTVTDVPKYDDRLQVPVKNKEYLEGNVWKVVFVIKDKPAEIVEAEIAIAAEQCRKKALAGADAAVAAYMAQFSAIERETWSAQQREVEAYELDKSAPTPVLDALAASRGISREELLAKAAAKVAAFVPLSCQIVGTQQKYEDHIKKIVSSPKSAKERLCELEALTFDYSVPEDV